MQNLDSRFEAVEIKLSELELTVNDLNAVVVQQYRDIEMLRLDNERLSRRLEQALEPAESPSADDEKPPHY